MVATGPPSRKAICMATHNIWIELGAEERVSAILAGPEQPAAAPVTGVVLAHGAGNDMHTPVIATVAEWLAGQGFATLRFNFPYREKGKKSPDPQARLEHAWRCAWHTLKHNPHLPVDRMVAAGKSMGGRIASQLLADDELDAVGLILLGYPLHPPGNKDRLRDAHLYRIRVPMLFFAGTRDTLCDLERLDSVLTNLKARHELTIVEGGNHSFALPNSANRSAAKVIEDIAQRCVEWLEPFR